MKYLLGLLIFVPMSFGARFVPVEESLVFLMACLAIVPLAVIIGDATEQMSLYTGPKIGGLLNATMGNVPELFIGLSAVQADLYELVLASMAVKNKVDLCVEIAVGSSMQIAMFVSPLLILASFGLGAPLIYVYDPFEVVAVLTGIALSLYVFQYGKTYWLEGALLIFCYIVFGVAFFFVNLQ